MSHKLKKVTIETMQALAKAKGGKCLSAVYINNNTKLKWQCKRGHIWQTKVGHVKAGHWCPTCASRKHSIEDMRKLAKSYDGQCLSNSFQNVNIKLKWKCAKDHIWMANPSVVKAGRWCLDCKKEKTRSEALRRLQAIAKKRGGKCLSQYYITSDDKLEFQCKEGHRWFGIPYHIQSGVWCPVCGGSNRLSIEEMRKIAEEHGGHCLSKKYVNATSLLKWCCGNGHTWTATGGSVRAGSWCRKCSLENREKKYSQKHWKTIAKQRGGKCLSVGVVGVKDRLLWRCSQGHEWHAIAESVQRGTWCNICADKVRADKKRHDYSHISRELKSMQIRLLSSKYESALKPLEVQCEVCRHEWSAKWGNLQSGFGCPRCAKKVVYWDDIKQNVKARFGKLVSRKFISAKSRMIVVCANNHHFETTWDRLKRGSWCPYCPASIGERLCRLYFEHLFRKPFPKVRPSWLKSGKTRGVLELDGYCEELKLAFEHQGEQHYKYGSMFARDRKSYEKRVQLDELKRRLCKKNDITLIEVPEVPSMLPLENLLNFLLREFRKKGVVAPNTDITTLNLRPAFLNSNREHLSILRKLARNKRGKCLSTEYINNKTKMTWQCKRGHTWQAVPSSIKNIGTWCPQCIGRKPRPIRNPD